MRQLKQKIEELEDEIGKGDVHTLRIEWEDGTPVATWETRGDAFIRVVPDYQSHQLTKGDLNI